MLYPLGDALKGQNGAHSDAHPYYERFFVWFYFRASRGTFLVGML